MRVRMRQAMKESRTCVLRLLVGEGFRRWVQKLNVQDLQAFSLEFLLFRAQSELVLQESVCSQVDQHLCTVRGQYDQKTGKKMRSRSQCGQSHTTGARSAMD